MESNKYCPYCLAKLRHNDGFFICEAFVKNINEYCDYLYNEGSSVSKPLTYIEMIFSKKAKFEGVKEFHLKNVVFAQTEIDLFDKLIESYHNRLDI